VVILLPLLVFSAEMTASPPGLGASTVSDAVGEGVTRGVTGAVGGATRARPHRRFAPPTHPLHTRIANIFGTFFFMER
jgi:hypothetical protein